MGGVLLGGAAAVGTARVLGMNESVADYGTPFHMMIGGAWFLGLIGCYLALSALRDPKVIPTVVILAMLLPGSAAASGPLARTFARWFSLPFGTLITVGIVLLVLLPMLSPVVARLLAAIVPWKEHGEATSA
jgi:hypothetical protein